jgi:peptidoglycan/xylan/chitin deacetylase (PgdA/CDA1 family)
MELLHESGAQVISLRDGVERLIRNDLPECAVCITFDDGAYDFSERAVPILSSAGVHATLYLTTYYCGRRQPVFDTMASYLLWKARGRSVRLPGLEETVSVPMTIGDPTFVAVHTRLRQYAFDQGLSADDKHALAAQLAARVGQDFDDLVNARLLQLMSKDEVSALDERTVAVQLHTHRHRTPRDRESFLGELRDNAQAIHALRPNERPLDHFCYPSGDYVREYADWLREFGVQWATTCDPGLATRDSDPFFLPRFIDTEAVREPAFLAWVSGLSTFAYAGRTTTPVRLQP